MYNFFKKFSKIFELVIGLVVILFSGGLIFWGVVSFLSQGTSRKHLDNQSYLLFGLVLLIILFSGFFVIYKHLRSK